jgi:peptide/nickel transport system substrate-binding protein
MKRGRPSAGVALVAIGVALVGASPRATAEGGSEQVRRGGTFRIVFSAIEFDSIDPALSYTVPSGVLLETTCARLMTYSANPRLRLVPEVAAGFPRVSRDGKTHTFTLRSNFRFNDGTAVRASAFARAIHRTLAPGVQSPGAQYTRDIVGADDFRRGRTSSIAGVTASGDRLIVRFTRPVPDFAARMTQLFFCAVPPGLPADPEGVGAFPAAGPYFVSEYRPGRRIMLQRNPFYRGVRPHHVDRFVVDLGADSPLEVLDRVERGQADWGWVPPPVYFDRFRSLVRKYGVNKAQFFVAPGLAFRAYALNTSRPLFRNNPRLRRAVNYAVDRAALQRASGGAAVSRLTDQYLPSTIPGFRNARIYPLEGPNLRKARALARGHTRGGKAVLYTFDAPLNLALAQIVKRNLARIGLDVQVKGIPIPAYGSRVTRRDEAFDIAFLPWFPDYLDPYSYLNVFFESRFVGAANFANFAHFTSPRYDRLLRRAAGLQGRARYRAYGELDVQLARDAAPLVAVDFLNDPTLVSKRVGCISKAAGHASFDLTSVCLN